MEDQNEQPNPQPSISRKLVEAITAFYEPAENIPSSDETKSTQEFISEMSSMEEIFPYEINKLMEEYGFKIHYDGNSFVWLLKFRNT